ncbi:23 kDa integral membrane protein-like [Cydia fagiglandana]|uniref:23 kDa integral membrane protein-like n=1 Tax=Cydia fagiglandana TaxID=1458189 RepID=UPI002FEE3CF4
MQMNGETMQTRVNMQNMKFTKTEAEYNLKSIRFLLLTITTMFIIVAGLMVVLGFSVYSEYHDFAFFYGAKGGRFVTLSALSVFIGMVLLVVTSFGFFGSLKQSTCLVNLYAFFLSLILIVMLVVVTLACTLDSSTVMKYFSIPISEYTADPEIQAEIDSLQYSLNCCGSDSYLDYLNTEFTSNHSTVITTKETDGDILTMVVPASCCSSAVDVICTRLRTNSCKDALVNMVIQNSTVIGVLGVSVMFIKLLGIIFALLLARCIRKSKSERALIQWKIREQMILARQHTDECKAGHTGLMTVSLEQPTSSNA